jgi:A/G-specific adenine glycosylase
VLLNQRVTRASRTRPPDSEPATDDEVAAIRRALIGWFRAGHRDMPWRRTRDPYAIWVSEIMLQQTRVETVTPYFSRWMARFPTVTALAEAPLDDVLASWAGLGYYARARNLHAAAREVTARYGGRFPDEPAAVRALPGIGPYTAGAILSIAFGRPEPILDGNVARVLSRVFLVEGALDETGTKRRLWALAAQLVPPDAASEFNQGMMELGATVCTPRAPGCLVCPLTEPCGARRAGTQEAYPLIKRKAAVPTVDAVTVLVERNGRLLFLRRPAAGLWGGLWEPPTGELACGELPHQAAARVVKGNTDLELDRIEALARFEHVLTHRRMRFHPYRAVCRGRLRLGRAEPAYEQARWLAPASVTDEVGVAAWAVRLLDSHRTKEHEGA